MSEETSAAVFNDGAALVVRSNEELPEKLAKAYARLMPLYDFFCEVYRAAAESGEEKR